MIGFAAINRSGSDGHNAKLQRHHLVPLQAKSVSDLTVTFDLLRRHCGFRFDDWKTNGVLLPCDEQEAFNTGQPLHRGPHPRYNQLVLERLIAIDRLSKTIPNQPDRLNFLRFRVSLLQSALRQSLLQSSFVNLTLNRNDPSVYPVGYFDNLDDCVDRLYSNTSDMISPERQTEVRVAD